MSLLNLPSDGLHSVLVAMHRTLEYEGPIEKERLLDLCGPEEVSDPKQVRQTMNRWLELGLLRESNGKISLNAEIPKCERTTEHLPSVARQRLMAPENNEKFWELENSRGADFSRTVSWFLAQDVYEFEPSKWEEVQSRIQSQAPGEDRFLGKNDTRWTGFRAWAPFLGFGYVNRENCFIIDPTPAVRNVMPVVFAGQRTMAADDFQNRLCEALPVIDGGEYRLKVEILLRQATGPKAWHPTPDGQISTSMSRALLGLAASGSLGVEMRSDAKARLILTGRDRRALDNFSHLTWFGNE
jgi:hypothetical protein